ncbi:hypothetical protein WILDE_93 [Arthrobacter phage Wilde]|uniref:Uncharacterized protein n=1 Tax=Arthrobacter phage Wilde TaxID=1772323 RepID=A0A0U4JVV8_9CAUD|nr:hypothetical protein WILDE_93 [Arthrobacter phage Wilde]
MKRRTREVIAGLTTALLGFTLAVVGIYNIDALVQSNQLINLLAIITLVPGGIGLVMIGVKVVDP